MSADEQAAPLEIHDLTVSYHKRPVLWGVDLEVPAGRLVGVVGPNGAGKSTLIKAAMGLLPVDSGWVKVFVDKLIEVNPFQIKLFNTS